MFSFNQTNPSYQLLSVHLILSGVLSIIGFGFGTLTLMLGLLAGLMMLYDTYNARRAGVKNLKRGVPLLGLWLTMAMGFSLLWFAVPSAVGLALPFVGVAAAAMLFLEERRTDKKGMLLTIGWLLARSAVPLLAMVGVGIPAFTWSVLAILGIAAGYFLIQDK